MLLGGAAGEDDPAGCKKEMKMGMTEVGFAAALRVWGSDNHCIVDEKGQVL